MKRVLIVPFAVTLITACGGGSSGGSDNGEGAKSASTIANDAAGCLHNTHSVHIKADVTESGQHIAFDLDTQAGGDAAGSVTYAGSNLHIVSVGGQSYFNAGSDFWTQFGNAQAAAIFAGKWVSVPAGSGADQLTSGLASITDYSSFASSLTSGAAQFTKGGPASTPDGRAAVTISSNGNKLYVSTTGAPCPLYVTGLPGNTTGSGYLSFTNYNSGAAITPPPNAVTVTPTPS